LEPLNQLEAAALQAWQQRHNEWELDCKADAIKGAANEKKVRELAAKAATTADYREKARELLKPGDAQAEPTAQRYVVNDATVEKLGVLLSENPWGLLAYRDEIFGLLTSLDKQGQEGSRAFYLQAYDGNQGYTVDRIGRPKVHIPRVCFALLGGITPGRVQEYVRGAVAGGSGDDGLLQRFSMAVWPEVGPYVYVDQYPDFAAKEAVKTVIARLAGLEPVNDAEPQVWRFDDAAQALFAEWLTDFENEIRSHELHPAMVSHLAKYRKLIPALALQFALIDTPDSGCKIGEPELIRALGWGDYLRTHAVRLYAAATIPEITGADFLLSKLKAGKLSADGEIVDGFTPRQVAQKGWTGLTSTDDVRKAADVLADYDWLRRELVPGGAAGGRPSDRYLIHPSVLQKGKL
jgi:putative DNA primase/helicase